MSDTYEHPLSERVTYRLSRLQAKLNAQARRLLKDVADLTLTEWRVLVMINETDGVTMAEIGRRTQFDKGQLSRCIKGMVQKKLLTVLSDEADMRLRGLRITDEGRRRFALAWPAMRRRQDILTGSMSAEARAALWAAMDHLEAASDIEVPG